MFTPSLCSFFAAVEKHAGCRKKDVLKHEIQVLVGLDMGLNASPKQFEPVYRAFAVEVETLTEELEERLHRRK
jgi:hypothetical protein